MRGMGEQAETPEVTLEVAPPGATGEPGQAGSSESPESPEPKSCFGSLMALGGVVFGGLYVVNPTAGLIELIPDNIPLFGNLDEAAATTLLVLGLQYLFRRRR